MKYIIFLFFLLFNETFSQGIFGDLLKQAKNVSIKKASSNEPSLLFDLVKTIEEKQETDENPAKSEGPDKEPGQGGQVDFNSEGGRPGLGGQGGFGSEAVKRRIIRYSNIIRIIFE